MQYLSKSDYKLARTCPTKLYYKKLHYPALTDGSAFMELLEEDGYLFEALAKLHYPDGVAIDETLSLEESAATTLVALQAEQVTLFEATFISAGKLVRVDILVKDGNVFDLIEVKSKSYTPGEQFRNKSGTVFSAWLPYLEDVAFQALVLQECFPAAEIRPFLLLPDSSQAISIEQIRTWFQFDVVGRAGEWARRLVLVTGDVALLQQEPIVITVAVGAEVAALAADVRQFTARLIDSLNPLRRIPPRLSHRCASCEYRLEGGAERNGFVECWRELASAQPHLLDLYYLSETGGGGTPLASELIAQGTVHLFDVPIERLRKKDGSVGKRNQRQIVQIEYSRAGREWLGAELPDLLAGLAYPLHFLDFETARYVLPSHASLKPYALEAFQWSCHTLAAPGAALQHTEWINREPTFPNERFARSLMAHLGTAGTVLAWAAHESMTLRQIAEQLAERNLGDPALHEWLATLGAKDRIVDMNALTIGHYFHPLMRGQTSLKVVADAIWRTQPELRARFATLLGVEEAGAASLYKTLPSRLIAGQLCTIQNGTDALRAYQSMLFATSPADRTAWQDLLRQYCRLDTLAMVLVWERWAELSAAGA
ncbi:MAG: DUF2779 domain-containing protein [Herpetosiphonaceae bacterium]|nr:DUF2779 domain-containing protein [Herpetosiphonaceae bacterium]